MPILTITDNISTYLDYKEEMRLWTKIPSIIKKSYRLKYSNARKIVKQIEFAKGRVQKLLEAAITEDFKQFCEYNED